MRVSGRAAPRMSRWLVAAVALLAASCAAPGPQGSSAAPTAAPAAAASPAGAAAASPAVASPAASPQAASGTSGTGGVASGTSAASGTRGTGGGARRTIKVGTIPVIGMAPFLIAQARGYFAQEGLDLEFVNFQSGAEMISPLSTGQIDAAINVAPNAGLVNAMSRGLAVRIVADNGSIQARRNVGSFLIRKDLQPGSDFADLRTLKTPVHAAATGEGTLPHALVQLTLQKAGVPLNQIDMTFIGLPDMNVAFSNGRLDFGASGEPLLTIGEQQGQIARWKPMNDEFPGMLYSVMLFGPNLLSTDKDLGVTVMRVYLKGARDFEDAVARKKDRAAIVDTIAAPLRLTPDLFNLMEERGGMVYIDPDGRGDPTTLKPVIDFWAANNVIGQAVDPQSLVDFSAADAAVRDLGKYTR